MQTIDLEAFERTIQATKVALREGILSINIWNSSTGLILTDWQGNGTAVALLSQLMAELDTTLEESISQKLTAKDYIYLELKDDKSLVVINHGDDIMQGWLIDSSKVQPGILLGMAVPNAIANIESAKS